MIYRHTIQEVNNYYNTVAINQSSLKTILQEGIQKYIEEVSSLVQEIKERKHFIIGSAVDCKITMGEEAYAKTYHESTLAKKPGPGAMAVLKEAFNTVIQHSRADDIGQLDNYPEILWEAMDNVPGGYFAGRKKADYREDTRIAGLVKEGREYWTDLCDANGKQVLSEEETAIVRAIHHSFTSTPRTAKFINDAEGIDIIFQFAGYFTYKGVLCKFMIDELYIIHGARRIVPLDFKTMTGSVLNFNEQVKTYKYDLQGSFYTYGLKQCLEQLSEIIGIDVTNYSIANFGFLVESTTAPGVPLVCPLTDKLLEEGAFGDGKYNLGWEQGIDTYLKWRDVDFSIENMLSRTGGVVFIDTGYQYTDYYDVF